MTDDPKAATVYTVISADAHAGLPTEQYRDYLEKKYWPQFDEFLADRVNVAEEIHRMGTSSEEFAKKWFEENEEGLEGGWDAERRNKEMDNDGITAEVIFPDADAVESRTCAPFGVGLGLSGDIDPELGLAGSRRTTAGSPSCARTPPSAAAAQRSCRSPRRPATCSPRSGARTTPVCAP